MIASSERPSDKCAEANEKFSMIAGGGGARAACLGFGAGFGAGAAYTECQQEVSKHSAQASCFNSIIETCCM